MSWVACAYVKKLRFAPNGEEITKDEKLVLLHLADCHNEEKGLAWPSVPTIAEDCRICKRKVQYILHDLARNGVISIIRPEKNGRGRYLSYRFPELDARQEKDAQHAPFAPESQKIPETCKKNPGKVQQRCMKDARSRSAIKEELRTENERTVEHHTPDGAITTDGRKLAFQVWLATKERLKSILPEREWQLWVRPAYLCNLLSGYHLLIALPPSNAIIRAAKERQAMLRNLLAESGYNASFTKYPDAYELGRLQTEFPEFYAGMFGIHKRG